MSYIKLFFPNVEKHRLVYKPRPMCVEDDLAFVTRIFPDQGFATYFTGYIISKLAKELKAHGITDYHQRSERPELADLSRFLSNIRLIGEESGGHDRRGTRSSRDEVAQRERKSAGDAEPLSGKTEEGKEVDGSKEAGLDASGLVMVCPTCKEWKFLEVCGPKSVYCRRCEEGCVTPLKMKLNDIKH